MHQLIQNNEAVILKENQKKNSNGVKRCLVQYKNSKYLLCNNCNSFKLINDFCDVKNSKKLAGKNLICKECAKITINKNYNCDFIAHLRYRYKSIESNSKKHNAKCLSFEDFINFARQEKEPIYQITLEQAFKQRIAGEFEVEHKTPISKGGTSLLENLTLSTKAFNRLKGVMNVKDTIQLAKLIVQNEQQILENYDLNIPI